MSKDNFSILITSLSKKVPLIKAVRHAMKGSCESSLFGGDSDPHCIGRYFVDHFWVMPLLDELSIDEFIEYCVSHNIQGVIPTRDGELLFFSQHRKRLAQAGIVVMVSDDVSAAIDKLRFFETVSKLGYPAILTTLELENMGSDRYVVKERFGAGSHNVQCDLTYSEANRLAKDFVNPVFQPYHPGKEVSVDLYVARNGKVQGCISRWRDFVVAGESQVTHTFLDETLEEMCCKLAEELSLYGHVMFQLIRSEIDRSYHFLECNPRFGGASTLSLAMGLDSFGWFFKEIQGVDLDLLSFKRFSGEKKLIRHSEDYII